MLSLPNILLLFLNTQNHLCYLGLYNEHILTGDDVTFVMYDGSELGHSVVDQEKVVLSTPAGMSSTFQLCKDQKCDATARTNKDDWHFLWSRDHKSWCCAYSNDIIRCDCEFENADGFSFSQIYSTNEYSMKLHDSSAGRHLGFFEVEEGFRWEVKRTKTTFNVRFRKATN